MAWVNRLFGPSERRNLNNPRSPISAPTDWLFDALGGRKSSTGVSVTPENSLETTTVWAAVRMISSTLATLPLVTYRHTDAGKDRAREHPVYHLLHDRPNPEMSSFVWREMVAAHLLLWGNSYNEIERNGRGEPIALWPLPPANVRIDRIGGKKVYLVRVDGKEVPLDPKDIIHIPGFSLDGQSGLLPVALASEAIGLSKALEEHGARYFANSATPSGILSHPGRLGPEGAEKLRASWAKLHGGLSNSQRIAVLEEGLSFSPLSLPNDVSQFLESRKFSVSEVARVFNIPPHLIGDLERATFSNIEHQGMQYVTLCIEPLTRRIEMEISYKLFDDRSYFAEFVLEGLLRGDSAARAEFYTRMANLGVYSINEIRERENLNRIEGGDERFVPLNMAPLGQHKQEAA